MSPRFEAVKSNFPGTASRSFTLVYGDDYETLDLIAETPEKFRLWHDGLKQILRNQAEARGHANRDQMRLQTKFEEADTDGNGTLSKSEIVSLLMSMNVLTSRSSIDTIFKKAGTSKELDFREFENFLHMIGRR